MRHHDNIHRNDRNLLMKNTIMPLNIFINAFLLASYMTLFNARTWNIQRCIEICILLEDVFFGREIPETRFEDCTEIFGLLIYSANFQSLHSDLQRNQMTGDQRSIVRHSVQHK
jgi:hypothetical protein